MGSGPSPVRREDECGEGEGKKKWKKHTNGSVTHPSDSPAASFMTSLDDTAPEEQVVHNVIPLKDEICSAKQRSLTATFVRRHSGAARTSVHLFTVDGHAAETRLRKDRCWKDPFVLGSSGKHYNHDVSLSRPYK